MILPFPVSGPDGPKVIDMNQSADSSLVQSLMEDFARRTGLDAQGTNPRRYLWTDAYAVCNFLELYRQTKAEKYLTYALRLINQVHQILGRHRKDDPRNGWISGLDESQGAKHPTAGGLRIGKLLPERNPEEPVDEAAEWEKDGQYYHYLTKWMHALHLAGKVTGDGECDRWARELAIAAHAGFTYGGTEGKPKKMYWKMSTDLTRPLVSSMGQHDPLDGLITYYELSQAGDRSRPYLSAEIEDMIPLCRNKDWTTNDPLGAGGLLADACRLAQMAARELNPLPYLLEDVIYSARLSLDYSSFERLLSFDARQRLAFREFGLSIGLHAAKKTDALLKQFPLMFKNITRLSWEAERIISYDPMARSIEAFWLRFGSRSVSTWIDHEDINSVMLATSLMPDGFLTI